MRKSQDIRWLLRDKYAWDESKILQFLDVFVAGQDGDDQLLQNEPGLLEDLRRLEQGEPLPYVIGWVSFLGCQIDLRYKPLIPRPETEYWVDQVLRSERWQQLVKEKGESGVQVLDLCCGSGCIGIAALKHEPTTHVEFVDIQASALQQTQLNLELNHISSDRAHCTQSNLFESLPPNTYDVIFSNPPYVDPAGDFSGDLQWEPSEALFAQNNGFALIEEIFSSSRKYLRKGGLIVLEFGKGQEQRIAELCVAAEFSTWQLESDQYGIARYVWAVY